MITYIDCIPCFYRQIIDASRIADLNDSAIKEIMNSFSTILADSPLDCSPPEIAGIINAIIVDKAGVADIYKAIKEKSTKLALSMYGASKEKVAISDDPLLTAVEMAIAGNIIDFGVKSDLNIEYELDRILRKENSILKNEQHKYFAYEEFESRLARSGTVIYLADNVGETIFDRILIEEIKRTFPKIDIHYVVKEQPILNDALIEDAVACGIDKLVRVISSGSTIPGTVLKKCSDSFLDVYRQADMVISKGQGNFESFVDQSKPVFYLFMAKCHVVAKEVGCQVGSINLYHPSVTV